MANTTANITANITAITAPCTCTVDGVSGNTSFGANSSTFAGCGAHIKYHDRSEEAGCDDIFCYVTSPEDCPDQAPFVPEGLEWRNDSAALKKCYDGYRCEAWWGDLKGETIGTPAVLPAPLDWPDCCALCSDMEYAPCEGWRFTPITGACQLLSAVEHSNRSGVWRLNASISGLPGYFEAPINESWNRGGSGNFSFVAYLLSGPSAGMLVVGVFFAAPYFLCALTIFCCLHWPMIQRFKRGISRPGVCLVKATCTEVSATTILGRVDIDGRETHVTRYSGQFVTRDMTAIKLPHENPLVKWSGEQDMLRILFHTKARPLGRAHDAYPCERTPGALRMHFSHLKDRTLKCRNPPRGQSVVKHGNDPRSAARRDCLLLMGPPLALDTSPLRRRPWRRSEPRTRQVMLVGILAERRMTCIEDYSKDGNRMAPVFCITLVLIIALALLLIHGPRQGVAPCMYPATKYRNWTVCCLLAAIASPFAPMVLLSASQRYFLKALPPAV